MDKNKDHTSYLDNYIDELKKENKFLKIQNYFIIILNGFLILLLVLANIPQLASGMGNLFFVEETPEIKEFAQEYTTNTYGIYSAEKLSKWIDENIIYKTVGNLKAGEIFQRQEGVCKENAVLLVSFMKSLGYEAQVVYLPEQSHAIVKVYSVDNNHYYCDPTQGSHHIGSANSLEYCWRIY